MSVNLIRVCIINNIIQIIINSKMFGQNRVNIGEKMLTLIEKIQTPDVHF